MMRQKSNKTYVTHLMKSHQEIDVIDMLHQSRWKNCISKEKLIQSIEDTIYYLRDGTSSNFLHLLGIKWNEVKYQIFDRNSRQGEILMFEILTQNFWMAQTSSITNYWCWQYCDENQTWWEHCLVFQHCAAQCASPVSRSSLPKHVASKLIESNSKIPATFQKQILDNICPPANHF